MLAPDELLVTSDISGIACDVYCYEMSILTKSINDSIHFLCSFIQIESSLDTNKNNMSIPNTKVGSNVVREREIITNSP
jgi:hypothetical protein